MTNPKITFEGIVKFEEITGRSFYDVVQSKRFTDLLDMYHICLLSAEPEYKKSDSDIAKEITAIIAEVGFAKFSEEIAQIIKRDLGIEGGTEKNKKK